MNILNISGPPSPNALAPTVQRLRSYFSGHEVTMLILDEYDEAISGRLSELKIDHCFAGKNTLNLLEPITLLPGPGYVRSMSHVLRNMRTYDLVHVYGGPLVHGPVGYLASKISRAPFICRFNGYTDLPESRVKRALVAGIEKSMLASDGVVFNAENQKRDILDKYSVDNADRFRVIPPGVDAEHFRAAPAPEVSALRTQFGIAEDSSVVGACMTPRPVKRLDRCFEMLRLLDDSVQFVVVGDSRHVPEYRARAAEMGLADRVHWVGSKEVSDLYRWYSLFDVTIMTSDWESFGMSITESYLCGVPCVAFDTGGMADQILHGETGYLADPYNVPDLAEYVEHLLTDLDRNERFASRGQEFVMERFTLDEAAKRYERLVNVVC